jgi:hypothetical protein
MENIKYVMMKIIKSFNNSLMLIVCLLMTLNCYSQDIKIDSTFFPLKENATYYYRAFFNGQEYTESIKVRRIKIDGNCIVYYFKATDGSEIIGPNMFGLGLYLWDVDGLYTIVSFWESDIDKVHCMQRQKLMPKTNNQNIEIEYLGENSNPVYHLTLEGTENVIVPAGQFKDCLKIRVLTKWDSNKEYISYVWLAKGVGLVKWRKDTGRIEELLKFEE